MVVQTFLLDFVFVIPEIEDNSNCFAPVNMDFLKVSMEAVLHPSLRKGMIPYLVEIDD